MSPHFPALLVTVPLLMAFITTLHGWLGGKRSFYFALFTTVVCSCMSLFLLVHVLEQGPILYKLAGWSAPIGITYRVDGLNAAVLTVMSIVAFFVIAGTKPSVERELFGKEPAFYALAQLALCGHLGMSITADAFNLYVLLEITALSGYALLAVGRPRAYHSVLNYLLIGTIGASFYLLGVGFLYIKTGSLDMLDIAQRIQPIAHEPTVLAAIALIVLGMLIKMACFPVHAWLPNAYTHASSAASSLLGPMTTKVMVYVVLRMILTVFTPDLAYSLPALPEILVWCGTAAIIVGAIMALAAKDFKRMLTCIILSEVGYMVGGAWLGTRLGFTGAALHLVGDALMTVTVFLAAACLTQQLGRTQLSELKGAFGKMPVTMGAMAVGAMAMIGVPPTCGFYSKWYLLRAGIEQGQTAYVIALLLSSLVNVVLFFRIFEIGYFEPLKAGHGHGDHGHELGHGHGETHAAPTFQEAPFSMVAMLIVAAASCIALGFATPWLVDLIDSALPPTLL
ncbi:proton-conducting transporter transmembrane domain-containing protein [Megalodesulfovibrio paquesii]